ncbi:MAG: hypothetical protein M1457_12760 [bacterium]|nr:hypothetical protein [bacterium]
MSATPTVPKQSPHLAAPVRPGARTLLIALGIFLVTCAVLLWRALRATDGHFVYALDDAYIHMAIARNWALHGVWGITPVGFSSSTSSPLWTLLLGLVYRAAGAGAGVGVAAPFAMNAALALILIAWLQRILGRRFADPGVNLLVLLFIIYIIPLPALVFTGLEHVLAILVVLPLLYLAAGALARGRVGRGEGAILLALAALAPAVRYEGLFLVLVAGLLFMARGRRLFGGALGVASVIPVGLYGAWSVAHGWHWLPNSVLLKGNPPDLSSVAGFITTILTVWRMWFDNPYMIVLCLFCMATFANRLRRDVTPWTEAAMLNLITAATIVLHMTFARMGWLFRYEAYLVAMGAMALALAWQNELTGLLEGLERRSATESLALACVALLALLPFMPRLFASLVGLPHDVRNTYEQQYQMARFLNRYYAGQPVAINDIGAVSYMTDVRIVDLFGLANPEIAREKLAGNYTTRVLDRVTRAAGVRVAMVYDKWYKEAARLPRHWIKVGEWEVDDNRILGDATVAIYGTTPEAAARLGEQLSAFAPELPATVQQRFFLLPSPAPAPPPGP